MGCGGSSQAKSPPDENPPKNGKRNSKQANRKDSTISVGNTPGNSDVIDSSARPKPGAKAKQSLSIPMENGYVATRRRSSVSAEAMNPNMVDDDEDKVYHEKSLEAMERIRKAVQKNFLFKGLLDEVQQEVFDAMFERQIPEGEALITQGEYGDFFYVVDAGRFDIFVMDKGTGQDRKVMEVQPGGSFGELALMYNAPRAATCMAAVDSVVWALDRMTFRRTILANTSKKRQLYEEFISKVPVMRHLEFQERTKITDTLVPQNFQDGDVVVAQGEQGDTFYIVEEGELLVKMEKGGEIKEMTYLGAGDYFGEIALLRDEPRVATVIAQGKCRILTLDKAAFQRLLGPLNDILQRNISEYPTFEAITHDNKPRKRSASIVA